MFYMGVDVGSVSTDFVIMDESGEIRDSVYIKTKGMPIAAICEGLSEIGEKYRSEEIAGVGTTGSGRILAGALVGADTVKNEITTHATAAASIDPEVRTIIEIGGQDSKIILLQNGIVRDFAMNTVCAAGTGSFLDRQAERMGLSIEKFVELGLLSEHPVGIAGRCAVFSESDIIHKQQLGVKTSDIISGISEAMTRNYLSNVAKGKRILPKIFFQGGVASNEGIRRAFETKLGYEVFVPEYHKVMGAFGAALMAKHIKEVDCSGTKFKGFVAEDSKISSESFKCEDCRNSCDVTVLFKDGVKMGCFSDKCGKHQF